MFVSIRKISLAALFLLMPGLSFGAFQWQTKAVVPSLARGGHAAVSFHNRIWVIGGDDNSSGEFFNDVWCSSDGIHWVDTLQHAPFEKRAFHTAFVYNDAIWVIGGTNENGGILGDIWSSPNGISWTLVTSSASFGPKTHHSALAFGQKIWIFGGENGSFIKTNDAWTSTNGISWTKINETKPFPARDLHGSFGLNNQIWIIGGAGGLRDIWSSLNGVEWTQRGSFSSADESYRIPSDARNIQVFQGGIWSIEGITTNSTNGATLSNRVRSTFDGINWQKISSLELSNLFITPSSVVFQNKLWIIGGRFTGQILASKETFALSISSPDGQVIRSPVSSEYDSGTTVHLTPFPNQGYRFTGWSGSTVTRDSVINITMDGDKDLVAHFTKIENRTLTVSNLNGAGRDTTFTIPDHGTKTLTTLAHPPRKAFLSWQVASGSEFVSLSSTTSTTTTVTLFNGNATIKAVYDEPKVRVYVKNEAPNNPNGIQPVIKIVNDSKTFPLTNFDLYFYFNTECFGVPSMTNFTPQGWTTFLDTTGLIDKVKFTYNGTLLPGQDTATSHGLALFYSAAAETCTACPLYWDKTNDKSLNGAGSTYKELTAIEGNDNILVVDHPSTGADTLFGHAPPSELSWLPGPPSLGSDPFYQPLDPPLGKIKQIPNVTSSWVFPLGNFVRNGSFEEGTTGWNLLDSAGCVGPKLEVEDHGPSPLEAAYDGFHYARVNVCGDGFQGIYSDITESDPAFNTLLNGGPITISAWVRGDGTPGTDVDLIYYQDSTTVFGSDIVEVQGEWKLLQLTVNTDTPFGPVGQRKYRFGIAQGGDFNGPIFVDGVTIAQGYAYIPPQVSYTWTNTRNMVMQKRFLIPAEPSVFGYNPLAAKVVSTNTEYDSLGRISKAYLPVADSCPSQACNPFFDSTFFFSKLDSANRRYIPGNAEGLPSADTFYAYSKTLYEQDQLTTVLKTGGPGKNFQIEDSLKTTDHHEHSPLIHYAGVNTLTPGSLGNNLGKPDPTATLNPAYSFTHSVDPDKHESLQWKNSFGQVVKTAAVLTENNVKRFIATENVYDERGNLIKTLPPISCEDKNGAATNLSNCVSPTTYVYDTEARLTDEFTPDANLTRFFYDFLGTQRITENAEQRLNHRFTVSVYDDLGRIQYTGEYHSSNALSKDTLQKRAEDITWPSEADSNFTLFAKYFYDEMPPAVPPELMGYNTVFNKSVHFYPSYFEGTFEHTKGKLCAVLTYQNPVEPMDTATLSKVEEYSTVAYRYDKYGRNIETFRYNGFITDPVFKMQRIAHQYDVSGRLSQTTVYDDGDIEDFITQQFFTYDAAGRLLHITDQSGPIADYAYYPSTGQVKTLTLNPGNNPITVDYVYDISGKIKNIKSVLRPTAGGSDSLYTEELYYDVLPSGSTAKARFNGNIAQTDYLPGHTVETRRRSVEYSYDDMDRLLNAVYYLKSGSTRTRSDKYSESMKYLDDGRIAALRRAASVKDSVAGGGAYNYFQSNNRLAYVTAGMDTSTFRDMTGSLSSPAFAYDSAGRLLYDRSRDRSLSYDFRGLPVEFSTVGGDWRHKDVMRYDESGSRISKLSFDKDDHTPSDLLVDSSASREKDYPNLAEGLGDAQALVLPRTTPDNVVIYQVTEGGANAALGDANDIVSVSYQGGKDTVDFVGLHPGTPEYDSVIGARNRGFSLTKATHYTGFGNEVREETDIDGDFGTKVLIDLPNGLGRYNEDEAEKLYYLKNNLGSTVVSATGGSATANGDAYEYFPYGRQDQIKFGTNLRVTPTFTGKELDDESGLYYFGARYLDPELAVWITPDIMRQFSSLYLYCGNGGNPIGYSDKSGMALGAEAAYENEYTSTGTMPGLIDNGPHYHLKVNLSLGIGIEGELGGVGFHGDYIKGEFEPFSDDEFGNEHWTRSFGYDLGFLPVIDMEKRIEGSYPSFGSAANDLDAAKWTAKDPSLKLPKGVGVSVNDQGQAQGSFEKVFGFFAGFFGMSVEVSKDQ
jgi:RHS repeat-associated protein